MSVFRPSTAIKGLARSEPLTTNSGRVVGAADLSRRRFIDLGLKSMLTASVGPAIVRAASLMQMKPLAEASMLPPSLGIAAIVPSHSTGFVEALWKQSQIQQAMSLKPIEAANESLCKLLADGRAKVHPPHLSWVHPSSIWNWESGSTWLREQCTKPFE